MGNGYVLWERPVRVLLLTNCIHVLYRTRVYVLVPDLHRLNMEILQRRIMSHGARLAHMGPIIVSDAHIIRGEKSYNRDVTYWGSV